MLLIHYNYADLLQRGKNGGACADYDAYQTAPDAAPFVVTLSIGQAAVQDGDTAAEAGPEAADKLGSQ